MTKFNKRARRLQDYPSIWIFGINTRVLDPDPDLGIRSDPVLVKSPGFKIQIY